MDRALHPLSKTNCSARIDGHSSEKPRTPIRYIPVAVKRGAHHESGVNVHSSPRMAQGATNGADCRSIIGFPSHWVGQRRLKTVGHFVRRITGGRREEFLERHFSIEKSPNDVNLNRTGASFSENGPLWSKADKVHTRSLAEYA